MAGDVFDSVFSALAEQVPTILSNAVKGGLSERGLYVAQMIHEERVELGRGVWFFTIYVLQIEPNISIPVFRFLSGELPDGDGSLFCAPPHQLNVSIDVEIASALKWARKNITYEE